jgi:Ricin-type beta-trefoil lectin domain-like
MRPRGLLKVAVVVCLALAAGVTPSLSAAAQTTFPIHNLNSGLCLDDTNWSRSSGTQMQQWGCSGGSNQTWDVIHLSNPVGSSLIENMYSGLCLDLYQDKQSNGTPVVQWTCDAEDEAQLWLIYAHSVNGCSSCVAIEFLDNHTITMEIYNWSKSNGGKVDVWAPNSNGGPGVNQLWYWPGS